MNTKVGNFFVSIGRGIKKGFFGLINWIKTTAWIQPLLIVAVILGIILCIKPIGSLIGNLFNPDTTYQFYRQHTADMDDVLTVMNKDGTSIVLFYSEDSSSKDAETAIINFNAANPSVSWYCINVDGTSDEENDLGQTEKEQLQDQFANEFLDQYDNLYYELPESMKDSNYPTTLATDSAAIPTPLFARYDKGELYGVKVGVNSTNPGKDLDNFINGTKEDWANFTI